MSYLDVPSSRYRGVSVLGALALVVCGASGEAQIVRVVGPQRVTVTAEGIPIGDLLDQLSAIAPLERLTIDPVSRALPVSLVAEDVHALDAMFLALKAAGLDFVMSDSRITAGRVGRLDAPIVADGSAERIHLAAAEPPVGALPEGPAVDERSSADEQPPKEGGDLSALVVGQSVPAVAERATPMGDEGAAPMEVEPTATADEFGRDAGAARVPFTIRGDSVVFTEPGFVPLKLQPDVQRRRRVADLAAIP